jgi:hypothetical protein
VEGKLCYKEVRKEANDYKVGKGRALVQGGVGAQESN